MSQLQYFHLGEKKKKTQETERIILLFIKMSKLVVRLKQAALFPPKAAVKVPLPEGFQHPEGPPWPSTPITAALWEAPNVCANTRHPLGSCQPGEGVTLSLQDKAKQSNVPQESSRSKV